MTIDPKRALSSWEKYRFPQVSGNETLKEQAYFLWSSRVLPKIAFYINSDVENGLGESHRVKVIGKEIYLKQGEGQIGVKALMEMGKKFIYTHEGVSFDKRYFGYERPFEMYKLPPNKVKELQEVAGQYRGGKGPVASIFQVTGVTDKSQELCGRHIGCRIIDPDGTVYSFGKGTPYDREIPDTPFFTSKESGIAMHNWEETSCEPHKERFTVSIPITAEKQDKMLSSLNGASEWLNLFNENCVKYAHEKIAEADPEFNLDIKLYPHQVIASLLPGFSEEKELERRMAPEKPKSLIGRVCQVLTFIPKVIASLICHLVLAFFGGFSSVGGAGESAWKGKRTALSNPFDYESLAVMHSKYLLRWMKKQGSFQRFSQKEGCPKLHI